MKKRLFIITNDPVPYGTANSNYIRNFANAVFSVGWDVIVIGNKKYDNNYEIVQEMVEDDLVKYWNLNVSRSGAKNYLKAYFGGKNKYLSALRQFRISAEDYIVLYSTELSTAEAVLAVKEVPLQQKSYVEVEWFQPYQYKNGRFSIMYNLWKIGFMYRVKNFKKAIPISQKLKEFCNMHKCSTLIVPPLVDTETGDVNYEVNSRFVNFIYPGAASDKDSFSCMLNALNCLDCKEKKVVRFHLTGSMSKEKLGEILGNKQIVESLEKVIVYHGWMTLEKLYELYRTSDYLLLARDENVVTLSNFPSKVPEMMNYGIVPVCSNVGDYTQNYLTDGVDSIQFDKDNIESCVNALRKAIKIKNENKLIQMKIQSRETAVKKFEYRMWGEKITDFLQKVEEN